MLPSAPTSTSWPAVVQIATDRDGPDVPLFVNLDVGIAIHIAADMHGPEAAARAFDVGGATHVPADGYVPKGAMRSQEAATIHETAYRHRADFAIMGIKSRTRPCSRQP